MEDDGHLSVEVVPVDVRLLQTNVELRKSGTGFASPAEFPAFLIFTFGSV